MVSTFNQEKRRAEAFDIYDTFLSSKSPTEINVNSDVRGAIEKTINGIKQKDEKSVSIHIFDQAQKAVFSLMLVDQYPHFLQSSAYREMSGYCFFVRIFLILFDGVLI